MVLVANGRATQHGLLGTFRGYGAFLGLIGLSWSPSLGSNGF